MGNAILVMESLLYLYSMYIIINAISLQPLKAVFFLYSSLFYLSAAACSLSVKYNITFLIFFLCIFINITTLILIFKKQKIKTILALYALLYSSNIIISSIMVFIFNISEDTPLILSISLLIDFIMFVTVSMVCLLQRKYIASILPLIPKSIKAVSLISIIASSYIINLVLDFGAVNEITNWSKGVRILLVFFLLIVGSLFPILISNAIGRTFYNKQAVFFESQIKTQSFYYEEQAKRDFELRRFKHDYKNKMIGIKQLLSTGNSSEAIRLLEQDAEIIDDNHNDVFSSGNGIVDAILAEKQKRAQEINCTIVFSGIVSVDKIAPTDLCIIFGNTIDNAIEACEKIKSDIETTITVVCKSVGEFVFITISNPIKSYENIDMKSLQTSKEDKSNHGFGLYSLHKTVRKYNGTIQFICEDTTFRVELELYV